MYVHVCLFNIKLKGLIQGINKGSNLRNLRFSYLPSKVKITKQRFVLVRFGSVDTNY